ncbi:hypothetical protein Leryth_000524 [Lithospermum erythrorhizon]|nr:hypothetical protein Leryth_000524 [Lithospermum erythrorhizon]
MSDFSFISDSDDEKAVETILSQAKDQIVLEQVAQINCSGFTDSCLPSHIETRFHKLKSFPVYNPKSSSENIYSKVEPKLVKKDGLFPSELFKDEGFLHNKKNPSGKMGENSSLDSEMEPIESKFVKDESFLNTKKTPSVKKVENFSPDSEVEPIESKLVKDGIFSPIEKTPERKYAKSSKSKYDSSSESDSSPTKSGCFWCSPKKKTPKKKKKSGKENELLGVSFDWEGDDELLADLESFSVKGQKRLMKKAMEEEEKINREAQKIVKWAKQASARFDDELSDDEHFK